MDTLNLKMFTVCNEGMKVARLDAQIRSAREIARCIRGHYAWCTTFGFDGMHEADWSGTRPFFPRAGLREWRACGQGLEGDRHAGH